MALVCSSIETEANAGPLMAKETLSYPRATASMQSNCSYTYEVSIVLGVKVRIPPSVLVVFKVESSGCVNPSAEPNLLLV